MTRLVILGGYGAAGSAIARLALRYTDASVVIAGRSEQRARACAETLGEGGNSHRVQSARVEASDAAAIASLLVREPCLLVLATPKVTHLRSAATAALDAGADLVEIQISPARTPILDALGEAAREKGLTFVTEAGAHPGLGALLVRYADAEIGPLRVARIAMRMNIVLREVTESILAFARDMLDYRCVEYRDGAWCRASMWHGRPIDFGPRFGTHSCIPIEMPELAPLPDSLGIEDLSALVAGFHWLVDWVGFPIGLLLAKVHRDTGARFTARMLCWASRYLLRPPYGLAIKLDAEAKTGHAKLNLLLSDSDGYLLTAAPIVAFLMQYLDGTAREPGIHAMGQIVEPVRFMADLERVGVAVERL